MAVTEITTSSWLKARYLFGIDLTDDDGNAYPEELYSMAIDSAIATVSAEFDLDLLGPTTRVERYDTTHQHGMSWWLKHLMHKPVVSVEAFHVQFANFPQTKLPNSWVQIANGEVGQIQILPGPEALANTAFSGGIPFVGISGVMLREYTPLWWKYTYTSGFERDLEGTVVQTQGSAVVTGTGTSFLTPADAPAKTGVTVRAGDYVRVVSGTVGGSDYTSSAVRVKSVESDTSLTLDASFGASGDLSNATIRLMKYPADILDCIGLIAALLPLDTAGDLIIGAGISRLNVGVDGLHQEIQTTSGVENSGYGARALQYRNRLKAAIMSIKRRYNPPKVMVM